ncbi:hypothetical protein I3760_Q012800 [Carya illinoinensis]|nr:hypothetical protein I3760_Q012800 [Carya illinoinensis]
MGITLLLVQTQLVGIAFCFNPSGVQLVRKKKKCSWEDRLAEYDIKEKRCRRDSYLDHLGQLVGTFFSVERS